MRISFRLRSLVTALLSTVMLIAVLPTADAQVWKPRTKAKPAAAVKRPAAAGKRSSSKARPRPRPTPPAAATTNSAAGNNGARPVDLVPDDENDRAGNDRADRADRVVRDAETTRSGSSDRRVGDTEVFVVIND
ncbi:MAG: hypothetical protein KBG15_04520 [Kofleriaceae bacterium]|nr:hypothetical protein [Kofleriaceae bacterium]